MTEAHSAKAVANCKAKGQFHTELEARKYGYKSLRKHCDRDKLWPYQCNVCNTWHLTKQQQVMPPITAENLIQLGAI